MRVNSKELPKGRSSSSARKGTGYITKVREGFGTVQMSGKKRNHKMLVTKNVLHWFISWKWLEYKMYKIDR